MNKHLFSFIFILALSLSACAQDSDSSIRTFSASCTDICDGVAELLDYQILPQRHYYWMSANEGRYRQLDSPLLDGLCSGKYRIRRVDMRFEALNIKAFAQDSVSGFDPLTEIHMSTRGKRDLTTVVRLNREVNHLNYYLKAEFSVDGGQHYKSSSQFHQQVKTRKDGSNDISYIINLPRSANNLGDVRLRIYERSPDQTHTVLPIRILSSELESLEYEEYVFEINYETSIRVLSTVSNEIEGNDGYINLNISGGTPPYSVKWDDGKSAISRKELGAGNYNVTVTDLRKCSQQASFEVETADKALSDGLFSLSKKVENNVFELSIKNIYRKPLDLVILDMKGENTKSYAINPLYTDLKMAIDLSYLAPGHYQVSLSTSGYSKIIEIRID